MKAIQKSMLTCDTVPEADANKLKRERRQISEHSTAEYPVERKTVKIWAVERPETEPVNEMYGRSKLARVEYKDGTGAFVPQQSLSDDDKT